MALFYEDTTFNTIKQNMQDNYKQLKNGKVCKVLTEMQEKYVRKNSTRFNVPELAEKFDVTIAIIRAFLKKEGLKVKGSFPVVEKTYERQPIQYKPSEPPYVFGTKLYPWLK